MGTHKMGCLIKKGAPNAGLFALSFSLLFWCSKGLIRPPDLAFVSGRRNSWTLVHAVFIRICPFSLTDKPWQQ